MLSHDPAAPGRHQNSLVFTTLEPLRPANEALLGGPRSLPGVKGPKAPQGRPNGTPKGATGSPKGAQMEPKGKHMGYQGKPNGAQREPQDPKGSLMDPKGSHMHPKVAPRVATDTPKTKKKTSVS